MVVAGAARFYPFRAREGVEYSRRSVATIDITEQRRAARWDRVRTISSAIERPALIIIAVALALSMFTPNWLVGLIVSAMCAAVISAAGRLATLAWGQVRLADELIGIPIPDGQLDSALATRAAPAAMRDLQYEAKNNSQLADRMRPIWRKINSYNDLYESTLHRARQEWVDGDLTAWWATSGQLPVVGNMIEKYVEKILDE